MGQQQDNPFAPPASGLAGREDEVGRDAPDRRLEGLGGWLILVGLGVVFSPLRILLQVVPVYRQMFESGALTVLSTPGNANYSPLWTPLVYLEIAVNGALVIAWIYLAVQYFGKKACFPRLYIGILLFSLVFQVADALVFSVLANLPQVFDPATLQEVMRTVVAVAIWVPYMLVSKRVKATFVQP